MPKAAAHRAVWMPECQWYALRSRGQDDITCSDDTTWLAWVAERATFAFDGKAGKANLRKEARRSGADGYWYAYKRTGTQVIKRYVGRTGELTLTHIEALAAVLSRDGAAVAAPIAAGAYTPTPSPEAVSHSVFPSAVFAAKLQPPRLRSQLVRRERLLARLDAGLDCRLTVISAPAGFGKTTSAGQWIADRSERDIIPAVSWLALDAGDNDPVRFWRYFIAACQRFHPAVGHDALGVLYAATLPPFEPLAQEALLVTLLNDLIRHDSRGLLVLEDYHALATPQLHEGVSFFVEHLPLGMHVMLLSRSDPPIPLARLRARGEMCELFVPDLYFTADEAREFFQQTLGVSLPPAVLAQIDGRVEGWAAGLRLIALALQGRETPDSIPDELVRMLASTSNPWPFSEYFISEVLNAQPEPVLSFLLLTSGLSRVCGSLGDAVTGRDDSASLLDTLEGAGLFLEPPHDEGEWYRYHALFAEVMQHEARRRLGEAEVQAAARRASAWYAAHEMTTEAIEMALQGQDFAQASTMIEAFIGPQLFILGAKRFSTIQEFHTLHRWLSQLPEGVLQQSPALCLIFAAAMLITFNMQPWTPDGMGRITAALDASEAGWRRQGDTARLGEVFAFRALLARARGAIPEAVTWAKQALAWLASDEWAWQSMVIGVLGTGAFFAGDIGESRRLITEARRLSASLGNQAYLRANTAMLAWLSVEQGELRAAVRDFRLMLAEAREQEDRDDIGRAQVALADLLYEWNDLAGARQALDEALEMGQQLQQEEVLSAAADVLARILHVQGQTELGVQQLAVMENVLLPHTTPLRYRCGRQMQTSQVALRLAAGDLVAVQRWWEAREPQHEALPRYRLACEELLFARLLLAQGQASEALARLHDLLAEAEQAGSMRFAIHVQVVLALAYASSQQNKMARQTLRGALERAHPEGYLRVFLDEGAEMEALLRSLAPEVRVPAQRAYLQAILRAFADEHGTDDVSVPATDDLLSPQEQRVLRLLVAGRTNPEIAAELIVSVNTVKAHVKSLYRKLNVRSRVEASATARRLHLV
ncbi:MAG: LuxR C-terminal-related transcriptional regulator [Ktedonobacterales bacterium]